MDTAAGQIGGQRGAGGAGGAAAALPDFAKGLVIAAALLLAALLSAFSGRYGYHRDELYFLAGGRHLAWGYPDQPPLVPVIAWLMSDLAPASLVVLRLPSAAASAALVLLDRADRPRAQRGTHGPGASGDLHRRRPAGDRRGPPAQHDHI
jgi:hypothetical protein